MAITLNRIRLSLRSIAKPISLTIGRRWQHLCYLLIGISRKTIRWINNTKNSLCENWYKQCVRNRKILTWIKYRLYRIKLKSKIVIAWVWNQKQINGQMAKYGTLFLTFGMLIYSIRQPDQNSTYKPSFPFLPVINIDISLRFLFVTLTLILMIVILFFWQKYHLVNIVKHFLVYIAMAIEFVLLATIFWLVDPLVQTIPVDWTKILGILFFALSLIFMLAVICKWLSALFTRIIEGKYQVFYWIIFWIVFTIGWLRGIVTLPPNSLGLIIAFFVGYIWFFAIAVIMIKAAWQIRRL